MVFPSPSIQSFYQKEVSSSTLKPSKPSVPQEGDGFAPSEIEAALRPLTRTWKPKGEYDCVDICDLQSGSGKVRFMGRIVNFQPSRDGVSTRRSLLTQGFHFIVVKDDTGVVAIKLLATGIDHDCLRFGRLVTVWTAFVADYSTGSPLRVPFVSMIVPVHPSTSSNSCIKFHCEAPNSREANLCRLPIEYALSSQSSQASGLMSLRAYMNSGHEGVPDVKILVCVSSIGARKTVKSRPKSVKEQSTDLSLIEVDVFDETANCALKLWEDKVSSARTWIPNRTVLLISNPYYRQPDKRGTSSGLGIGITSMVDVDPDFPDAHWLRREAVNRTKKESVYIPFPDGLWDAEIAIHGPDRTLFTLADVDDFARDDPAHIFTGKLNLIILGVRIIENWRRNMLCCFECCGVPLYANRLHGMCKNCQTEQSLHLNPRIIGSLADETGTVALGKLIWSDRAWTELFFGTGNYSRASTSADHVDLTAGDAQEAVGFSWQELVALDVNRLRSVEEQLEFSRVTLTFGWSPELGRLCVLGVEW